MNWSPALLLGQRATAGRGAGGFGPCKRVTWVRWDKERGGKGGGGGGGGGERTSEAAERAVGGEEESERARAAGMAVARIWRRGMAGG